MNKKISDFFKDKKFRYGSASVVFVAVIILLVVAVNVVFTVLASQFHWYIDMTEKQMYTVSKTSEELLGEISGQKVYIKFLQKKDKIEDTAYDYAGDQYLKQIHELALDYKAKFPDLIELEYIDFYAERAKTAEYVTRGHTLTPTTVIFDNGQGLFNIYEYDKFLLSDKSGFKGEHRITATVLSLCRGMQTAYIVTGHGEEKAGDAFLTILQSCGYNNIIEDVVLSDLTYEKILEDKPRLIVIINPQTDIRGAIDTTGDKAGEKNDVYWLGHMTGTSADPMPLEADQPYASLMVFADPATGDQPRMNDLPNLNDVLYTWGMKLHVMPEDLVKETQNNVYGNSDLYKIMTNYTEYTTGAFYNRVALDGAGTVEVFNALDVDNGAYLVVSAGAENENTAYPASGKAVLGLGMRNVMAESGIARKYNYAIVCSDSSIVTDAMLTSSSYADEGLITMLTANTTDERTGSTRVNIDYKDYVKETNVNSTLAEKKAFLVFMAAVVPVVILGVGIAVYVYRRNKV